MLYAIGYVVLRIANRWELWQDGKDWWFWADRIWSALSTPAAALLSGSFTTIPHWASTIIELHPAVFDATVAVLTTIALWLSIGTTARIARAIFASSARTTPAGATGTPTPSTDHPDTPTSDSNTPLAAPSAPTTPMPSTNGTAAPGSSRPGTPLPANSTRPAAQPQTLHLPEPAVVTASTAPTPPAAWSYSSEPAATTILGPTNGTGVATTAGPTERIPAPSRPPQAATAQPSDAATATHGTPTASRPSHSPAQMGDSRPTKDHATNGAQSPRDADTTVADDAPAWQPGPSWHDEPDADPTPLGGPSWHDEPSTTNGGTADGNATEILGQTTPRRA